MSEFTPEQEAEIQERIEKAKILENYKIAGHQAYKESIAHLSQMVDQYDEKGNLVKRGIYDPYVLKVLVNEQVRFVQTYFPQPKKEDTEKKDDE